MCLSSVCVHVCKGECIVSSVSVMQLEETVCAIDPLIKVSVFTKNVKKLLNYRFYEKVVGLVDADSNRSVCVNHHRV